MGDQYELGERVFAKMKGYPPWPAKVYERVAGKEEKYRIQFYGTHDESVVKLDQMYRFNDETKAKYGKPQRKAQFKEAMEEIQADVAATVDPDSPAPLEDGENAPESEGELMIDETSQSLPPVLTRETSKSETTENSKLKRPKTLSKRDSLSSASGVSTLAVSPSVATAEVIQPPTTEIVSRSGRKIKPKRFADDEITSPITPVGKGAVKAAVSEESGPPAKRAKRASKSIGNKIVAPTPTLPEDQPEKELFTPTKPKAGSVKAKAATVTPVLKQSGRLSPDISAPMVARGPPSLKPAPVRRSGSANKKLPALIPTGSLTKLPNTRRSERQTRSKSMEDEENHNDNPPLPVEEPEVSEDIEDKENSANKSPDDSTVEENDESIELPIPSKKRPVPQTQKLPSSGEKKVRVSGINGLQFELSYDLRDPECKEEDQLVWQDVAKANMEKLKEDLQSDGEAQEIINGTAEVIESLDIEEAKSRETRTIQIRLLRLEGEVIEIIGEIVGCLNVGSADCDRAVELLERLESHQLNPLMLKKHPEVVSTVKRLRSYVGNVDAWEFTPEQKLEFSLKASGIRQKAVEVYKHFQDLFCTNPEDSFVKIFNEEVEKFKESIAGLPMKSILGLTEVDDSGELQVFDFEMNGDVENEEALEEA